MRRLALALLALALSACASAPPAARHGASPLERRALQTREFEGTDVPAALSALLSTLQDDGYSIRVADAALGLVTATRDAPVEGPSVLGKVARFYLTVASYGLLRPKTPAVRELEATGRIEAREGGVRVRVSLVLRSRDEHGQTLSVEEVVEPAAYQALFAAFDRSLFLAREAL